jgi:hypothetical protein
MDYNQEIMLSEFRKGVVIKDFDVKIEFITVDGKSFKTEADAYIHDLEISRKSYYDHLLERRNWLQKLFNIKPDMNYYNKMTLKILRGNKK